MSGPLLDLEDVLMPKKGKLTLQEANILESCVSKAARGLVSSGLAVAAAAWAATWKLSIPFRINLSAGAGALCGVWIFNRSLYSSAEQILTMDGSILQKELANIMVEKYNNVPSVMQLISKHFYLERIFDDSTSNNPKLRWRYRNIFSDNAVHGHMIHHDHESNDNSQEHSHNDSNDKSQGRSENVTNSKRTNPETKQTFKNESPDIMWEGDPLDCVFGYAPTPVEEIHHSNKQSGIHNRAHRRSHRRRRMRNHEDLSNSESV